jgi:hypothetical protein
MPALDDAGVTGQENLPGASMNVVSDRSRNCIPELVTYCLWFKRQTVSLVELHIFVESPLLKRTQRMELLHCSQPHS